MDILSMGKKDSTSSLIYSAKSVNCLEFTSFVRRRDAMTDVRTKEHAHSLSKEEGAKVLHDDRNVLELREYIEKQCEIIIVITNDISEAFQFFDSQNARGKKLFPHDLLKAYHLREMNDLGVEDTVNVVKRWEGMNQNELADLFGEYLYRVREWLRGDNHIQFGTPQFPDWQSVLNFLLP